jgi:hypothetical protein
MMMYLTKSTVLMPCMLVMASTMAFAQQQPAGAPSPSPPLARQRAYVSASTGASFGPQVAAVFAGEYGERVSRHVQAYVSVSYQENLMQSDITDDLAALSNGLTAATGIPWTLHGRDRGVALVAGGKYLFGDSAVRPYVAGGGGVIEIERTISDARVGDVTSAVLTEFGIGELELTTESETSPLLEAGAGVAVSVGRATYFDFGYRYHRAFHLSEPLDFSQFSASVGVRF